MDCNCREYNDHRQKLNPHRSHMLCQIITGLISSSDFRGLGVRLFIMQMQLIKITRACVSAIRFRFLNAWSHLCTLQLVVCFCTITCILSVGFTKLLFFDNCVRNYIDLELFLLSISGTCSQNKIVYSVIEQRIHYFELKNHCF